MEQMEIQFVNVLKNVSIELDMTSRTEVLKIIDRAKALKIISHTKKYQKNAFFVLEVNGIKILTDMDGQSVMLRVMLHDIAAVSYIYEDSLHTIAIKYGDVDLKKNYNVDEDENLICQLIVLYCPTKEASEHLCNCLESSFTFAYSKERLNAISNINGNIPYDYPPKKNKENSSFDDSTSIAFNHQSANYGFLSYSYTNLASEHPNTSLSSNSLKNRKSIATDMASELIPESEEQTNLSTVAKELIMDYMKKIYEVLTPNELENFAKLVKAWQSDLSFDSFCYKLLDLYGTKKKYLLAEMKPFIPAKDLTTFEIFLKNNVYNDNEAGHTSTDLF